MNNQTKNNRVFKYIWITAFKVYFIQNKFTTEIVLNVHTK